MNKLKTALHLLFFLALLPVCGAFSQMNAQAVTSTTQSGELFALFDEFFIPKSLRIDYIMAGDYHETAIYFTGMKQEPFWGGSRKKLLDPFKYGTYKKSANDSATQQLFFSKGFCNRFQE